MSAPDSIPPHRRDAVQLALRTAFGSRAAGPFHPISGGVSGATILRFEVGDRAHVLRLEPERIPLVHRARGFACMVAAAKVGAAPAVHYADAQSGTAIMDFVAGRALSEYPGGAAGLARGLGALVAKVQRTPLFPSLGDFPQWLADKVEAIDRSGLFLPGALGPHAEGLARIRAAYPWGSAALVSSHNDPNPRNLLFDGERLLLIDWELAFRNDALVDVAILTHELADTPALADILLEATFGRAPDDALRARLTVMRLLTRLYYGAIVLENFPIPAKPDPSLAAFTPAEFRAAVADGRLKPSSPEVAYAFAKMSLAVFLDGLREPAFEEALKRVGWGG